MRRVRPERGAVDVWRVHPERGAVDVCRVHPEREGWDACRASQGPPGRGVAAPRVGRVPWTE